MLGIHVIADGIFGSKTEKAVKQFQRSHRLQPDGIFGPATWACLVGERPERRRTTKQLSWSVPLPSVLVLKQVLILLLIAMGIYFSPLDEFKMISWWASAEPLMRSYALVCIVSLVLKKLAINPLELEKVSLLQFSPYFLVGFLHEQIFDCLTLANWLGS
ncbi:MAG: peptidoglycan-binding domain-containing protein [Cyanobacteria bacterium P01_F01_bin.153]